MTLQRVAIVAGERSGDLLGAGLIGALKSQAGADLELVGVGGPALEAQGLKSLFDYSELSIMGFSAVIAQLPRLIWRIRQTAEAIIAARPDCLIIVDSPDFTHRVARRVRKALPNLVVIDYVCPTVWAWKPERARKMRAYIDHVLAVFPFEPKVVTQLGGPPLTYVGHRLMSEGGLAAARASQIARADAAVSAAGRSVTCLLLPGSRRGEIGRLSEDFGAAAALLRTHLPGVRFVLPVAPGREAMVREKTAGWSVPVEIVAGEAAKWQAFAEADVAIAASGTVLLELALARIPAISIYRLDFIAKILARLLITWSAALPNLIAGRVIYQEYYDLQIRPERLARLARQLVHDTLTRQAVLADLDLVHARMSVDRPPEEKAAETVLALLAERN